MSTYGVDLGNIKYNDNTMLVGATTPLDKDGKAYYLKSELPGMSDFMSTFVVTKPIDISKQFSLPDVAIDANGISVNGGVPSPAQLRALNIQEAVEAVNSSKGVDYVGKTRLLNAFGGGSYPDGNGTVGVTVPEYGTTNTSRKFTVYLQSIYGSGSGPNTAPARIPIVRHSPYATVFVFSERDDGNGNIIIGESFTDIREHYSSKKYDCVSVLNGDYSAVHTWLSGNAPGWRYYSESPRFIRVIGDNLGDYQYGRYYYMLDIKKYGAPSGSYSYDNYFGWVVGELGIYTVDVYAGYDNPSNIPNPAHGSVCLGNSSNSGLGIKYYDVDNTWKTMPVSTYYTGLVGEAIESDLFITTGMTESAAAEAIRHQFMFSADPGTVPVEDINAMDSAGAFMACASSRYYGTPYRAGVAYVTVMLMAGVIGKFDYDTIIAGINTYISNNATDNPTTYNGLSSADKTTVDGYMNRAYYAKSFSDVHDYLIANVTPDNYDYYVYPDKAFNGGLQYKLSKAFHANGVTQSMRDGILTFTEYSNPSLSIPPNKVPVDVTSTTALIHILLGH